MMRFRCGLIRWFTSMASLTLSVAAPLLAVATASPAGAQLPPGLQPTEVNPFPTVDRSFLGPQLAVNPTNPDNIVLAAVADTGYTQACIAAVIPGSDCELIPRPGIPGIAALAPRGYLEPGFLVRGVFVSFDKGGTWTKVDVSNLRAGGRPELYSMNEGGLSVGPDGTFYLSFNAVNWGDW